MTIRVIRFLATTIVVFVAAVAAAQQGEAQVRYDDHALVQVHLTSLDDVKTMRSIAVRLMSDAEGIGFVEYVVSPQGLRALEAAGIEHRVLVENLQPLIDAERERLAAGGVAGRSWYDDYKTYEEHNAKLDELEALYPDLATVFVVGTSIEGREIHGIRITGPGTGKPGVLINGCQHAREWITPMVNTYVAEQLVTLYDTDPTIQGLMNQLEFIIIPIVNADGYVFTWGPDRLWRKNRRDNGDGTIGVDLNRNWAYGWGYDDFGSDPNPGGETYRGPYPFSEPESAAMQDLGLANPQIVSYLDIHSHGQLILFPWGYIPDPCPDDQVHRDLGDTMAATIYAVHGRTYTNQSGYELYPTNGGSIDWTYGDRGFFSYAFELRAGGPSGFELPPDEIIPNCEEIFPAIIDLAEFSTQGVLFSFPSGLPNVVESDVETLVQATITPITAPLINHGATLFTRVGAFGPFTGTTMSVSGDTVYESMLPAAPCGEVVQYYFQAETTDAALHYSPVDAPNSYYEATAYDISVSFADDFETDQGWVAENLGATSGDWERGVPVNDPSWEYDPASDGDGSGQCYLTQNQNGNTDVDEGAVRLTSPVLDGTGTDLTVGYDYFLRLSNDSGGVDRLLVEMSGNGDAGPWFVVATHDTDGGLIWHHHEMTQAELEAAGVVFSADMKIRFTANDADPQSIVESGVDGIEIRSVGCEPGPCIWDLDGSGDVGVNDFLDLLAAWGPNPGHPADFDGDDIVGVTDFLELLANWGPCP